MAFLPVPTLAFPLVRRLPLRRMMPRQSVLSDEEKERILEPSPYHAHRVAVTRSLQAQATPSPPARPPQPNNFSSLGELHAAVAAIRGDPLEVHGGRIVSHRGNPRARLVVVGEAPGEQENTTGLPFVGRAGQLLDKIFAYGGFDVDTHIYLTNVVKRRPPDNRNPTRAEIEFFLPYLREEIRLIDPAIVVLAGSISARALLGPHLKITKDRGNWYGGTDGPLMMPVLHPSYLLRVVAAKYDMVKDIEAIREKYVQLFPDDPLRPLQKK